MLATGDGQISDTSVLRMKGCAYDGRADVLSYSVRQRHLESRPVYFSARRFWPDSHPLWRFVTADVPTKVGRNVVIPSMRRSRKSVQIVS